MIPHAEINASKCAFSNRQNYCIFTPAAANEIQQAAMQRRDANISWPQHSVARKVAISGHSV